MSVEFSENSELVNESNSDEKTGKKLKRAFPVKLIFIVAAVLFLVLLGIGVYYYNIIYGNKLLQCDGQVTLRIKSGSNLEQITELLAQNGIVKDKASFKWVCSVMKYRAKSGQYIVPANTRSNHALISILRNRQVPVKLTFNNFRLLPQLAAHISRYIEADSISLLSAMTATDFLDANGLKPETAMTLFIPNSYQMYWDTDAETFVKKMQAEYKKFWNEKRLEKAKRLNLSTTEVYTLASIVDAETTYVPEKRKVAGVYLNRLKTKGWKLEADPTVVYAGGDFTVRRVTNDMLKINSPYNTYLNPGLPPGPIRMASVSAIDAVLDAEEHDYWFFCAKVPVDGEAAQHAFARNGAEHAANARVYRQWLNSRKIYK